MVIIFVLIFALATSVKKTKQDLNIRHLLYGADLVESRLKSRKTLLRRQLASKPKVSRIDLWREKMKGHNLRLRKKTYLLGTIYRGQYGRH